MKITYKTVALFSLAVFLPATAYMKADPDSFLEQDSSVVLVSHDTEARALQEKQNRYQEQLRAQSELVEHARQDAISAGIQGDGAQPYIDAYRQQQMEEQRLQAALISSDRSGALSIPMKQQS